MPGSSPTMARREPTMRLKSVDLPTLGRPTMATVAMPAAVVARVLVELYVGWVKMNSRSGGRLVLAELNVGKRPTMRKARNRYYRDSCGFKFPTRFLGL